MTDAKRAGEIIGPILRLVEENLDELADIVGRNQNDPPLGKADGSISVRGWYRLKDSVDSLREFAERMRRK